VPFAGVRIKGARIVDDVDLENAKLIRPIEISASRIENTIKLNHARTDSLIVLEGSLMNGTFAADSLRAESDLFLHNGVVFKSAMSLNGAKIDGDVDMTGASFECKLDADSLQAGGALYMRSEGQNKASFRDVVLNGAKITGQVSVVGASFEGTLNAHSLQVGGSLLMYSRGENKASFKDVVLRFAKITGQFSMKGASFSDMLDADSLQAGGHLVMRDANYAQAVNMAFVHISGDLDLRGASLADLNLSGATVVADLQLGGPYKSAPWTGKNGEPGTLNLRNTHIGNLMDAKDAWPTPGHLHLDGFSFNHLGGFEGETGEKRDVDWWDKNWAKLDTDYSPAPYAQLAAALMSAGARDDANEIRYRGREREREAAWNQHNWGAWLWWSVLSCGFGCGIARLLSNRRRHTLVRGADDTQPG
jgi:uncharacterized protein YjbI with pentapeptide repeats